MSTEFSEALDGWEIALALQVACPRCNVEAGERCVSPFTGEPSHIHPMRLSAYYAPTSAQASL
jgi:hypothetical protein